MLALPYIIFCLLSYFNSKDIFSPAKIYLAVFFVFFGESLFYFDKQYEFYFIIFMLLFAVFPILVMERLGYRVKEVFDSRIVVRICNKQVVRLWILTSIPVLAQIYFIIEMGGLLTYISGIGSRVSLWKGFGVFLLLIKLINIINYIYFVKIVTTENSKKHKILFMANFIVFTLLALLSGSRSMLLWNLVFMGVYYHYLINRISIPKASLLFGFVIFIAMVLGVLRDGYSVDESGFNSGINIEGKVLNMSNFTYGTKPVYLLLEMDELPELSLGKTYLTVFTNLIPRKIWPNKPDPGGIIFTRDFLDDPFEGNSYYSTGIVGEAFINFGYTFGTVFFFMQLIVMYLIFLRYIQKINTTAMLVNSPEDFAIYPFILFGLPAYLYAEFTTNTLSTFFFKVLLFILLIKFTNWKVRG
jgi:oligosaccharide repeat unit polymerase